uniref:Uncharacterized protein n=1 Tax=Panagrolaimus sp. ES5 TaxID=591445 RepID=A0AC34G6Y7_9BILA
MDSSSNPPSAAALNQESANKNSTMILSKRASFFASYRRHQNFSLPDSIMFYVSQNPTSSKVYEKMIQSCKYFFVKNPILVYSIFYLKYENEWFTFFKRKPADFKNLSCKIWITDGLSVYDRSLSTDKTFISSIVPKVYQSDIKKFCLQNQSISFNDFIFLTSKCETITFLDGISVKNEDCSIVPLEKLVEVLPKLTDLNCDLQNDPKLITTKSVKELIGLSNFANLTRFILFNIPDTFDIETLYGYIKKNKKTEVHLFFSDQISAAYKNRLQTIKDAIVQTENCDFIKPKIFFYGMH